MDNSTTLNATTFHINYQTVATMGAYVFIGTVGVIANGIVLFVMIPVKHNHDMLIAGLAAGDFFNAFGYLSYGIRGLIVQLLYDPFFMAPFRCIIQSIHIWCFEVGEASSSWMTAFVSMDRLIAMIWFDKYNQLTRRWPLICLSVAFGYSFGDLLLSVYSSWTLDQTPRFTSRCGHPQSVTEFYYMWHTIHVIVCGYVSIFFYLIALVAMKRRKSSVSTNLQNVQMKRQLVITKRIASVVITTFILQVVPLTVFTQDISPPDIVGICIWMVYALTPSINVFIYSSHNKEFVSVIKKIAFCIASETQVTQVAHMSLTNVTNVSAQNVSGRRKSILSQNCC